MVGESSVHHTCHYDLQRGNDGADRPARPPPQALGCLVGRMPARQQETAQVCLPCNHGCGPASVLPFYYLQAGFPRGTTVKTIYSPDTHSSAPHSLAQSRHADIH